MKTISKSILPFVFFIVVLVPSLSYAQSGSNVGGASGSNVSATIINPLKYDSIQAIVSALLQAVEYVGGIVCALYIIWAGFLFVKAQGNQTELEGAKKTITHALIGTAIVLGASVILNIVTTTINAIKS